MVNTALFQTSRARPLPQADAKNHTGTGAYAFGPKHHLAQLAATGCFNNTFYSSAEMQLDQVIDLALETGPEFVARTAIHARQAGHMKDMPVLLMAMLAFENVDLLQRVFNRVIDNGKMLRNFVQIMRSGVAGRKSLGTRPKKLVQRWLLNATEKQLLAASVGTSPRLADVVKMVHPKPSEAWRAAWFAWLLGRPYDEAALPPLTKAFEHFKRALAEGKRLPVPDVPFQMLTALELNQKHWVGIAKQGSWQMVRQNLNTFQRHGVFEDRQALNDIVVKLKNPELIRKARVLPYQLMTAYMAADKNVPHAVREALQDAMEIALDNVPVIEGRIVICPDTSGSMRSAVTGYRGSATSVVRCVDVAALVTSALMRTNKSARALPFDVDVVDINLNPRDSVMTNAQKVASVCGGGTRVSAPLARLNREKAKVDLVVIVSDNESWVDARRQGATQTMREWEMIKQRCPKAKLVCIDIQPYGTTQAAERADILNVGGFSDAVFATLADFAKGTMDPRHWVGEIEKIALDVQ